MKFKVEKRTRNIDLHYPEKEFNIARDFTKRIYDEFGDFIKAVILFGSTTKKEKLAKEADIDILIILDDVSVKFNPELVETYRIITEKILANMADGPRLHVQSMKLSNFWESVRAGDPISINVLRYGMALIDTGFFDPLQMLLDQGRIRPTKESIYNYFSLAPTSIVRAKDHMLSAMVDLYWATIDASHAALMSLGEIPPSPEHVVQLLDEKMVRKGHLERKYLKIVEENYKIFKQIVHRNIKEVEGKDYDIQKKKTIIYVNRIKKFLEKNKK